MSESIWSAETIPVRAMRSGKDEPLPERRELRAGPLTAVLENGDLRYVRLGDELIVLRLYGAIRDQNWDTIEPRFTRYEVESDGEAFAVHYTAENVAPGIDYSWEGRIVGTSAGVITATFDGVARNDFLRNRIGWCVLHPMELAGLPATVETPEGTVEGVFPDLISPHQPFLEMRSISHPTRNGGRVTIRFEGDLFEMEDQRNWTDASYKTYSTPLRLPYPVAVKAGDRVHQTVTIEVHAAADVAPAAAGRGALAVTVGGEAVGKLPAIGLGAAGHGRPLAQEELDRLNALGLAHLRVDLDLTGDGWAEALRLAANEAAALGAGLEIEAVAGDAGEGLAALFAELRGLAAPVARLLVFPRSGMTTTAPVLEEARRLRGETGLGFPIGGGSRAFFTELNRAELPLAGMEVVAYPITPQVHAFDNASLVETIAAQAETVRSAKAILERGGAGDRPLAIGPVTLRMRFNPNATGPEPAPAPGALPAAVDARQPSLFAAGWTAGSIGSLAAAGADSLTYYETTGWKGLLERRDHPLRVEAFHSWPGMVFPLYHVFADLAGFAGGDVLPVESGDPLAVAALAVRAGDRLRVVVASFVDEERAVAVALPGPTAATVRTLDETTFARAGRDPAAFRGASRPAAVADGRVSLTLRPFAVATIDGQPAG